MFCSKDANPKPIWPDGLLYFVKGMPGIVLGEDSSHTAVNGSAVPLTNQGLTRALSHSWQMAAGGLRILAMSYGPFLSDLTFVGLIGMKDPPWESVADAVMQLWRGGEKALMVTSDSKEMAVAIARAVLYHQGRSWMVAATTACSAAAPSVLA